MCVTSWFQIFNTGRFGDIVLGPVHVFERDGTRHTWNGRKDTILGPTSACGFSIEDTGVQPGGSGGSLGPLRVVVTWVGPEEALYLTGSACGQWPEGNTLGYWRLESF